LIKTGIEKMDKREMKYTKKVKIKEKIERMKK